MHGISLSLLKYQNRSMHGISRSLVVSFLLKKNFNIFKIKKFIYISQH